MKLWLTYLCVFLMGMGVMFVLQKNMFAPASLVVTTSQENTNPEPTHAALELAESPSVSEPSHAQASAAPVIDEQSLREIELVHLKGATEFKDGVNPGPPAEDIAWLKELEKIESEINESAKSPEPKAAE